MTRLPRILWAILVFGLGLGLGSWLSIQRRAVQFSEAVDRQLAEPVNGGARSNPAVGLRADATDEEVISPVMSALAETDALLRAYQLRAALGQLDSAQLATVFERAVHLDQRDRRTTLLGPLLARWQAIDPQAARAAVTPWLDRIKSGRLTSWQSVENTLCHAWSRTVPDEMLAEAMKDPTASWAVLAAGSAIEALGENDPLRQLEALDKVPSSRFRDRLISSSIEALANTDATAAEARLGLIVDPRERRSLQAKLVGKLAEKDPAAALKRVMDLIPAFDLDVDASRLVNRVLKAVGEADPKAALAAIENLPEGLRGQAEGAALVGWAKRHPIEALDWALARGLDLAEVKAIEEQNSYGAGWNSLVSTAMRVDRDKTMAWIQAQPPSAQRDAMLVGELWEGTMEQRREVYAQLTTLVSRKQASGPLLGGMAGTGSAEAEEWVRSLPPDAARSAAIANFVSQEAHRSPENVEALVAKWADGAEKDAAYSGLANSVSQTDPKKGAEYANQIADASQRAQILEDVAWEWLDRDQAAARAWIATAAGISAEEKRVILRRYEERDW